MNRAIWQAIAQEGSQRVGHDFGAKQQYIDYSSQPSIKCAKIHFSELRIFNDIHLDLTEGEDIKKRWQEYTEELYKKYLHDPDDHDGVITHLESDILECEVKGALGSITMNKASGGDGILVELFQILEIML